MPRLMKPLELIRENIMKEKTLHKGVNIVTNIASTSNPDKGNTRERQLKHLKFFGKKHKLTKSDWNTIMMAASTRLPSRLAAIK